MARGRPHALRLTKPTFAAAGYGEMDLAVFYHCYAAGEWCEAFEEFLDAIDGFSGPFGLGIVGAAAEREVPVAMALAGFDEVRIACREDGFENVTLDLVWEYAQTHEGAVLYAHTKGAANPSEHNRRWRHAMTGAVVRPWREHLERLEAGEVDVVSCFWITGWPGPDANFPGGNFWLATCEWIRKLKPVGVDHRYQCEEWVGNRTGLHPRVLDVLPGSPGPATFGLR